jgi:hypothetical protein
MRNAAVFVCLLLFVEPAFACHRFSHWSYPWAQRCGSVVHAARRPPAEPKDWYVEIVLTPQVMDEISHGVGIDKIKQLNAGAHP